MRFAFLAATMLALATACGGGQPTVTTRPTAAPGATTAATAAPSAVAGCSGAPGTPVGIAGNAFNPSSVTVQVGGTVTWANADAATHTVTFNDGPDCGRLAQAATVTRTFDTAGTFAYHCAIHPSMKGSVAVQ